MSSQLRKEGDSVLENDDRLKPPEYYQIFGDNWNSKTNQRSGWVDVGVYQPESVADHSFRTAFLCMLYADMEDLDPIEIIKNGFDS